MNIKDVKQWLVWADKAAPTSALTNSRVNWQNNLSTYAEAAQFCVDNPTYNLGFCFSPDTEFIGLDIDGCRNPATGEVEAWGKEILDNLPEGCIENVSVSGTGIKVIARCEADLKRHVRHYEDVVAYGGHTPQCELFVKSKYFAITAKELDETQEVVTAIDLPTLQSIMDAELKQPERTEVASGGGVSIDKIKTALSYLDVMEFQSRDRWFAILQGVHHGCGGSDEGYDAFREWSAGDEAQFNEDQLQLDWDSQDASHVGGITFGTVMHQLTPEQIATMSPSPTEDFEPIATEAGVVAVLADFLDPTNRNHTEVAQLFIRECGDNFRYVPDMKEWIVWDGVKWQFDKNGIAAKRELSQWTRGLADRVPNNPDAQQAVATARTFLAGMGNNANLNSVLEVTKTQVEISISADDMDSHPKLFNCQNGTLNLETGELQPHNREDLLTKCCGTNYVKDQDCPNWMQTLDRIFAGDTELISYVQRLSGYALSGEVSEEKFPVLYGSGCNGKSTFTQTLGKLFGEYTAYMPSEILNNKKDLHPTHIIELFGARLALMAELESNVSLAESTVKKICSQDRIEGRRMHRDPISFIPSHLVMLPTNHKPDVRNQDDGIWRRVCLIPFEVNLESVKDVDMPKKLETEMGGILEWLLQGYMLYATDGLGTCEAVEKATEEYREDEDNFKMMFEECFEEEEGCYVTKREAYDEYQQAQGRLGKINFYREMARLGYEPVRRRVNGRSDRVFEDIRTRIDRGTL